MSANGSLPYAPFEVSVSRVDGDAAVVPTGELDLASVDELTREVHALWSAGCKHVRIDLRPLQFMDSCGLRALLALQDAAARDGHDLALSPGRPVVQRIFDLTGTRDVFHWRSR